MDRRALPGIVLGIVGTALGVSAAHWGSTTLELATATCCLLLATYSVVLGRSLSRPQERGQAEGDQVDGETPTAWSIEEALGSKLAVARRHLWPVTVVQLTVAPASSVAPPAPVSGDTANDSLNEILERLGGFLRLALRESDLAARIGENRFVLVLDDTSEDGGVWTVERLQDTVEHETSGAVTLMAGLASYPTHALNGSEILRLSESALHRALTDDPRKPGSTVRVAPTEPAEPGPA